MSTTKQNIEQPEKVIQDSRSRDENSLEQIQNVSNEANIAELTKKERLIIDYDNLLCKLNELSLELPMHKGKIDFFTPELKQLRKTVKRWDNKSRRRPPSSQLLVETYKEIYLSKKVKYDALVMSTKKQFFANLEQKLNIDIMKKASENHVEF